VPEERSSGEARSAKSGTKGDTLRTCLLEAEEGDQVDIAKTKPRVKLHLEEEPSKGHGTTASGEPKRPEEGETISAASIALYSAVHDDDPNCTVLLSDDEADGMERPGGIRYEVRRSEARQRAKYEDGDEEDEEIRVVSVMKRVGSASAWDEAEAAEAEEEKGMDGITIEPIEPKGAKKKRNKGKGKAAGKAPASVPLKPPAKPQAPKKGKK
jgi:hypothetical protein